MRARTAALRPSPPRVYQEKISFPMEKLGGARDRIEFFPQKNIKKMRKFLKGINTEIVREEDRL